MKMGHLQNIQSFETFIETGNLQSYDEQSIHTFRSRVVVLEVILEDKSSVIFTFAIPW